MPRGFSAQQPARHHSRSAVGLAARSHRSAPLACGHQLCPRRCAFAESDLRDKTLTDHCELLHDELAAIRHTLDFPPEVLSGLLRYGLLVAHGARLRQLVEVMQPAVAERAFKKLIT
jgi:hypothetical protein